MIGGGDGMAEQADIEGHSFAARFDNIGARTYLQISPRPARQRFVLIASEP